jgi:pimeloyl-ACP methyl ester carboxylesterase
MRPLPPVRTGRKKVYLLLVLAILLALATNSSIRNRLNGSWTLQKFQSQHLVWHTCLDTFQCASLKVPVDYNHIDRNIFHLQVLKHLATDPNNRIGTIVVNPGGPGGSGADYAYSAQDVLSAQITKHFDIVGFDPRGVSSSEPIRCLTDKQMDEFLSSDGRAITVAQQNQIVLSSMKYADRCKKAAGMKLGHYSTFETAKDMEILRYAMHQKKLNYLGKSYGTYLGTLYAAMYPRSMGLFVLDGAIDPNISIRDQNLFQARSFDFALNDFIKQDHEINQTDIKKLISQSEVHPLRSSTIRTVTSALVITGIAASLYDSQNDWPKLKSALHQAIFAGNGQQLLDLSDAYTHRDLTGHYIDNENDISEIISCLDWVDRRSMGQMVGDGAIFSKLAPIFGPFLTFAGLPCHYWSAKPVTPKKVLAALSTPPMLIIGVTKDPATPYEWAIALHKDFLNSTLLTLVGEGHTGQGRGSVCIDSAVDQFFLRGLIPHHAVTCQA